MTIWRSLAPIQNDVRTLRNNKVIITSSGKVYYTFYGAGWSGTDIQATPLANNAKIYTPYRAVGGSKGAGQAYIVSYAGVNADKTSYSTSSSNKPLDGSFFSKVDCILNVMLVQSDNTDLKETINIKN